MKHKPILSTDLIMVLFFLGVILWISIVIKIDLLNIKVNKGDLIKLYQVDKKTFGKWIQFFCKEYYPEYKRKRKLSSLELVYILISLGLPEKQPYYLKKEIIQKGEGNYRDLKKCIQINPKPWGISPEVYHALSKFPPLQGKHLMNYYSF